MIVKVACSLSVSPSVVSNKAILTVTVSPSHPIPIDGQLILTTNSYWLRDSRNVIKIFDTTVQCSGSTVISVPYVGSCWQSGVQSL